MIVEDDRTTAVYEKKVLQNNGYDVVIAHSGESAIELVSGKDRVDLILMDIDLGSGIDGNVITSYSIHYTKLYDRPSLTK